jgi:hypothetical protein
VYNSLDVVEDQKSLDDDLWRGRSAGIYSNKKSIISTMPSYFGTCTLNDPLSGTGVSDLE